MTHDTVARLVFRPEQRDRWPRARFAGLARLEPTDPAHPYGRWSLLAELWSPPDEGGTALAWVEFLMEEAPRETLRAGCRFSIGVGPTPVAEVEVLVSPPAAGTLVDVDIFDAPGAAVRKAA